MVCFIHAVRLSFFSVHNLTRVENWEVCVPFSCNLIFICFKNAYFCVWVSCRTMLEWYVLDYCTQHSGCSGPVGRVSDS